MSYADEHKKDFAIEFGSAKQHHKILDDEYTYRRDIHQIIQNNPHKDILGRIASEDHHGDDIHQAVARTTTHPEHLDTLMHSSYSNVRQEVARNDHAQPHHLEHLMHDEEPSVAAQVAEHHNLQPHQVQHLAQHPDETVVGEVAKYHPESHERLINHPSDYVRGRIAQRTKSPEHMDKLAKDQSPDVRLQLAGNRHVSLDHQRNLMNDSDQRVRRQVAMRTRHREIAQHLTGDEHLAIRASAENSLRVIDQAEHNKKQSALRAAHGIHDPERDEEPHIHFKDHPQFLNRVSESLVSFKQFTKDQDAI